MRNQQVKAMTDFSNLVLFALPFSAPNLDKMQRYGVAFFAVGITTGERNQLISGARTIAQVIAAHAGDQPTIDSINATSNSFQAVFSTTPNGSTQDYYLGSCNVDNVQWARILGAVASPPAGAVYCKADLQINETWKVSNQHTNLSVLNALEGTTIVGMAEVVTALGWVPYNTGGYF